MEHSVCFRNASANGTTFEISLYNQSRSACSRGEDFQMDVGTFTVIGPSPIFQELTCIAGSTCKLQVLGEGISNARYMVLDTCGISSMIQGVPHDWAAEVVSAAGGSYQLCWCGSSHFSCRVAAEFALNFGQVQLIGPSLEQDRTCVAGQVCKVEGLLGTWLSDDDTILILESCGVLSIPPGFPSSGISALSTTPSFFNSSYSLGTSLVVSWGQKITAQAGDYRLCWCSGAANQSCEVHPAVLNNTPGHGHMLAAPSFPLDMGRLRIRGVAHHQDRTCVSGQVCSIDDILGTDLHSSDAVMALDTCGADKAIPRFAWAGLASTVSANGTEFSWGMEPVTAAGGLYRLCWCGALDHTCQIPSDFVVDFGALLLLGPGDQQIAVSRTCVSGERCWLPQVASQELPQDSLLVILDTCGLASQVPRFPAVALLANESAKGWVITAAAGEYRICWCGGRVACTSAEHFRADAGALQVLGPGPLAQHRTCVSGQACLVEGLTGLGLADRQGGTFAVLSTCGMGVWDPMLPALEA